MADRKDLLAEAAKTAVKQAAKKALVSAAGAVAPYIAIGCLIVLGIVVAIILICVIFVALIYATCNYAPYTIKFASMVSGVIPESMTTAKALSVLGPICDIFNK